MKKFLIVSLSIFILVGCDFVRLPPNVINNYLNDLSFIPVPAKGSEPLMYFDLFEYTGSITWKQDDGNFLQGAFKEDVMYTAELVLTPKKDYTFQGFEETFIHRGAARVTQNVSDNFANVNLEFARLPYTSPHAPVSRYLNDLSFIPVPAKGSEPLMYIDLFEYTGTVTWKQDNGDFLQGSFKEDIMYTAELQLIPKKEYTFSGFEEIFIHRGAVRVTQDVSDRFANVIIEFARVPGANPVHKYLTDLSAISAPALGEIPTFNIDTSEYTGNISWKISNGEYLLDSFKEGVGYTAEIYLTAKTGFTFLGFEGTFTHRFSESISQIITPNFATVLINFARLPLTDANFIKLTGTRLKTFYLTPDVSQLEIMPPVSIDFSGESHYYRYSSILNQPGYYDTFPFSSMINLVLPSPKALYNVGDSKGTFSGTLPSTATVSYYLSASAANTNISDVTLPLSEYIPNKSVVIKNTFEMESFEFDSYILPENGYIADKNYFEYLNIEYPAYTLTAQQSRSIASASFGYAPGITHVKLESEPFVLSHVCRQVSRDFYLYRSISISFDPAVVLHGWNGPSAIIDRFVMDTNTNTLTAVFKEYSAKFIGEVFSFFITAEDGSIIKKSVQIGN